MDGLKISLTEASKRLDLVAEKIEHTPELLGKANNELESYLEDTRTGFTDMLEQNLETNRKALGEVVDTIQNELTDKFEDFSSSLETALGESKKAADIIAEIPAKIIEVKDSFADQEADVAVKFETAASRLEKVSDSVGGYLASVENGITDILEDLSSSEENVKQLLSSAKINEDNSGRNLTAVIDETNRMLEGFKNVDINLKNIFESIGNEIVKYNTTVDSTLKQYLSSFEDGSKSFTTSIHSSVQDLEDTLNDLGTNIAEIQKTSRSFDYSVAKLGEIIMQRQQLQLQVNE